ncbi:MAG: hypothetical protein ACTS5A_03125 [Candidatus Hodgkinia cicadicola]
MKVIVQGRKSITRRLGTNGGLAQWVDHFRWVERVQPNGGSDWRWLTCGECADEGKVHSRANHIRERTRGRTSLEVC